MFFFSGLIDIDININLSVSSQSLLLPQMGLRRKQVSSRKFEGRGALRDDLYCGHLFGGGGLSEMGSMNSYNWENKIKIILELKGQKAHL